MQSYSFEMTFSLPSTLFLPSRVDAWILAFIARPWHAGTSRVGSLVFHRQRCGDEYFVCHISAHGRKRKLKCNFDVFFLIEPYLKRKIKRQIHRLPNCRKSLKNTTPTGWLVLRPTQCRLFSRTVWKLLSVCCNHLRASEFEASLPLSILSCSHNFERPSASPYTVSDWRTKQSDTTQTIPLTLILIEAMGHKDH